MKNNLLFIIFLMLPFVGFGQSQSLTKPTIRIEVANPMNRNDVIRQFKSKLNSKFNSKFKVEARSPFVLEAWFEEIDTKTIEGMDTYTYAEVTYMVQFKNEATGKEKKWTFTTTGKGESEYRAIQKSFGLAMKGKKEMGKVMDEILAEVESELSNNCNAYISKAKAYFAEDDWSSSLRLLVNISDSSACYTARKELEKAIVQKHQEDYCAKQIQQITVMVNSGVSYQLRNAVQKLIMISPDAPCAKEALKLSEQIGEKMEATSGKTYDNLNNHRQLLKDNNSDDWLMIFLKNNG